MSIECDNYEEAKEKIIDKFDIETLISSFEYDKIEDEDNAAILIELFNLLGITLKDYNERTIFRVDIVSYWKNKWKKLTTEYREKYISFLVSQVEKSIIDIETFKQLKESYVYSDDIDILNSVTVNLEELFETKCNISIEDLQKVQEKSFDNEFNAWRRGTQISFDKYENPQDIVELSLYFGREDLLNENKKGKEIIEHVFTPLKAVEEVEGKEYAVHNIDLKKPNVVSSINTSKPKQPGGTVYRSSQFQKDEDGIKAEKKVYDYLKTQFNDVKWMSGYAKELGINDEASDSNHYDIQYRDCEGEINFVEVKSTHSNDIEFKISKAEIEFARKHSKNYEIFVVKHNTEDIYNLGRVFDFDEGEDVFSNSRFTISSDSFSIRAKILE